MTEASQQIFIFMWLLFSPQPDGTEKKVAYYNNQAECYIQSPAVNNGKVYCRLVDMRKE